jgi:hypothetical protein
MQRYDDPDDPMNVEYDWMKFGRLLLDVVTKAAKASDGSAQDLLDKAREAFERRYDHE